MQNLTGNRPQQIASQQAYGSTAANAAQATQPAEPPSTAVIGAFLDRMCTDALPHGIESYRAATRARTAVLEAVLEGQRSVIADLPATIDHDLAESIVDAMANLGIRLQPSGQAAPK